MTSSFLLFLLLLSSSSSPPSSASAPESCDAPETQHPKPQRTFGATADRLRGGVPKGGFILVLCSPNPVLQATLSPKPQRGSSRV